MTDRPPDFLDIIISSDKNKRSVYICLICGARLESKEDATLVHSRSCHNLQVLENNTISQHDKILQFVTPDFIKKQGKHGSARKWFKLPGNAGVICLACGEKKPNLNQGTTHYRLSHPSLVGSYNKKDKTATINSHSDLGLNTTPCSYSSSYPGKKKPDESTSKNGSPSGSHCGIHDECGRDEEDLGQSSLKDDGASSMELLNPTIESHRVAKELKRKQRGIQDDCGKDEEINTAHKGSFKDDNDPSPESSSSSSLPKLRVESEYEALVMEHHHQQAMRKGILQDLSRSNPYQDGDYIQNPFAQIIDTFQMLHKENARLSLKATYEDEPATWTGVSHEEEWRAYEEDLETLKSQPKGTRLKPFWMRDGSTVMPDHLKTTVQNFMPSLEQMNDTAKYLTFVWYAGLSGTGIALITPHPGWRARKQEYEDWSPMPCVTINQTMREMNNPTEKKIYDIALLTDSATIPMNASQIRSYSNCHPPPKFKSIEDLDQVFFTNYVFTNALYWKDVEDQSLFDKDLGCFNLNNLTTVFSRDSDWAGNETAGKGLKLSYTYYGMWMSRAAWHVEDSWLYRYTKFSLNYLHYGSFKRWFTIPNWQGIRFENILNDTILARFDECDMGGCVNPITHKLAMTSPEFLEKNKFQVTRVTQRAGQFVVVDCIAYHMVYNSGTNCGEAVNWGDENWIEFGKRVAKCPNPNACPLGPISSSQTPSVVKMEPYIKLHQSDEQYRLWLKNRDLGPHPADLESGLKNYCGPDIQNGETCEEQLFQLENTKNTNKNESDDRTVGQLNKNTSKKRKRPAGHQKTAGNMDDKSTKENMNENLFEEKSIQSTSPAKVPRRNGYYNFRQN